MTCSRLLSFQTSTLGRKELFALFRIHKLSVIDRGSPSLPPMRTANFVLLATEDWSVTGIQTNDLLIIRQRFFCCATREPYVLALKSDSAVWTARGSSHHLGAGKRKVLMHVLSLVCQIKPCKQLEGSIMQSGMV